ncbi:MAG TPA: GNAT family N-acetyltransferase, partial [Caulobacteraceae bacterium]
YAASLPVTLDYQDFGSELASLPGEYAPPGGALFLARGPDGQALGCAALRPAAPDGYFEMKRLFLHPHARGSGLGRALAEAVVAAARARGGAELRLDTLPGMTSARALYASMGFRPISPYYGPVPAGTAFMALSL